MSFSASTTTSSTSSSSHLETDSDLLRPLRVSAMAVHAGVKDRTRRHARLQEVKSISVAPLSSSENLTHFEVIVFTKTTPRRPATQVTPVSGPALSMVSEVSPRINCGDPVYRIKKHSADFARLRSALRRAVQVTHLLSSCTFCKAMKAQCVASEQEGNSSFEASSNQYKVQLSLQQFANDLLGLIAPPRLSSDERVCYGKLQCWHILTHSFSCKPRSPIKSE